jgi:beta-glucanase (GH16 family)
MCTTVRTLLTITLLTACTGCRQQKAEDGLHQPAPEGYKLVWQDEFNDHTLSMPDERLWWYEVWDPGYVNHELQRYVKGRQGDVITAEVSGGTLKIHAVKVGNEVISARINTAESWKYGYFEARLKLPAGKGTWPAFWMMPEQEGKWPDCGEIDIMEEVGYNPGYVSSSVHCKAYNHVMSTQKTKETLTPTAQTAFHVYALEWTENFIRTFVDGKELFYFANDRNGNSETWPFDKPFYLKLNLAWGGDWGGAQGVDESALPATFEIDYVRVFQK